MVLFYNDKFCYSHMKTFHITESISKCEQVQSITLTRYFLQIEIWDIFQLFFSMNVKFCVISRLFVFVKIHNSGNIVCIFCGGK